LTPARGERARAHVCEAERSVTPEGAATALSGTIVAHFDPLRSRPKGLSQLPVDTC
jgi:hypothetical protein